MKIRQLDLQSLLYQVYALSDDHSLAMRIIRALDYNTLEIEGFIRDEWIKVVLGNPKTFPPRDKDVILAQGNKILGLYQPLLPNYFEPKENSFERLPCFRGEFITHWRLAPKTPAEKEG